MQANKIHYAFMVIVLVVGLILQTRDETHIMC